MIRPVISIRGRNVDKKIFPVVELPGNNTEGTLFIKNKY
jgi:hypothetical protein